jgi:transposase
MDYFAGLDISMDETLVCVLDRKGVVVRESKTESTGQAIAGELAKAPSCHRIVFKTGRMAPILFHGLNQLGLPVVSVESRQAYQAIKSLATHKTDRSDARGLAHLARTGFFKPVHVKSLQAHALRSLIIARKKLVGQRVTLETKLGVSRSCSGSGSLARSPPPSSTRLLKQARGPPVSLPPCGD